jgi:L-iditol 2-dehydrogenase
MKCLMKTEKGEGNILIQDVPRPAAAPGNVLIKVRVAAVCGTDVHIYYDRFANSPPLILGHEFSGVVAEVGQGVKRLKPGQRVVSANNPGACGQCRICSLGYPNLCPDKRAMGIHANGCFAEYVLLPEELIHVIPDNVSFEEAALTEPLAVSVHCVSHRCRVERGDAVVVFGAGAIGLLAAQVAAAEGAGTVLLAGTSRDVPIRLKIAEGLGLKTINVEEADIVREVLSSTGGYGADVVIEASGSPKAIEQGLRLLRRGGRMGISGITGQTAVAVNWDALISKAVSLFFAYSSTNADWDKALRFLAKKKVQTRPLITHSFRMDRWREAFHSMETMEAVRAIFTIGTGA